MDRQQISRMTASFDQISHKTDDGVEFWYARELMPVLGYARWENFTNIIEKAKISCKTVELKLLNVFVTSRKHPPCHTVELSAFQTSCSFATHAILSPRTEIVHSEMKEDGRVKVYVEKPDEKDGFHNAVCWVPGYQWEDIHGFTQSEVDYYQDFIESIAHIILELSQCGGFGNAANL